MQDFEPYFCTFEDCKAPFDIPNSFDDLLDHLQTHLPVRHHVDEPGGEHKEFVEMEFEHHLKSHGKVSDGIMAAMKEATRRKGAFLFDSCPFCGGYPDVLEKRFPDPDILDAQRELRKHIKQHMQEIALFLPPYRSDIFDDDDTLNDSDVTHRRSNNDNVSLNPEDIVTLCDRKDCDCKDLSTDEPQIEIENASDSRWMCCLCGNDFGGVQKSILNPSCTHPDGHQKCQSCHTYKVDLSHEGDWSQLLGDSSFYNRSDATDEELFKDERLHSFILKFAFGAPSNASERLAIVRDLVVKNLDSDVRNEAKKESLPLDATSHGTSIIGHLLMLHDNANHQEVPPGPPALWSAAENGQLDAIRQLFANGSDVAAGDIPMDLSKNEGSVGKETYLDSQLALAAMQNLDENFNLKNFDLHQLNEGDRTEPLFHEAVFQHTHVWIEWKVRNFRPSSRRHARVMELIRKLSRLNETGEAERFRIPPCLGYVRHLNEEKKEFYGIVFRKPSPKFVSLRHLLADGSIHMPMPSLSNRIHLMRLLYVAMHRYHATGGLYRGICSDNILLFNAPGTTDVSFNYPYFSCTEIPGSLVGDDMTERGEVDPWIVVYRHPDILTLPMSLDDSGDSPRYETHHELYSLGLVLLEIALWKPINDIMGIDMGRARLHELLKVRERLLTTDGTLVFHSVQASVGTILEGIIKACIEGVPSPHFIAQLEHIDESADDDIPVDHEEADKKGSGEGRETDEGDSGDWHSDGSELARDISQDIQNVQNPRQMQEYEQGHDGGISQRCYSCGMLGKQADNDANTATDFGQVTFQTTARFMKTLTSHAAPIPDSQIPKASSGSLLWSFLRTLAHCLKRLLHSEML